MKVLLTGDLHLQEESPIARLDDYLAAMHTKLQYIKNIPHDVHLDAGDVFSLSKPTPFVLSFAIRHLRGMYTIAGNHDLPGRTMENMERSGLQVLNEAGTVTMLSAKGVSFGDVTVVGCNWNEPVPRFRRRGNRILVWHTMCWCGDEPYPGAPPEGNALTILRKYAEYDLILTGHNHQSFEVDLEGRKLVNVGSIMRREASQYGYQPRVALYDTETHSLTWENVPVLAGTITREHLETEQRKDARIESFVTKLKGKYEVGLSFRQNMDAFLSTNRIHPKVREIVENCIGE